MKWSLCFSDKLMLFFYTTLWSTKIFLKHPGKCTLPTCALIPIDSSASRRADAAGWDVHRQLGPGRSVPLLPRGMRGWSSALPPPPGPARPGRCVTVTPSGFAEILPRPRKERRLGQFDSNQTSLYCLLKLLHSFIQQWRSRCHRLLTDLKFMF